MRNKVDIALPEGVLFLEVFDCGTHLELALLIVHRDHRGRGVGGRALDLLKRRGKPVRLTASANPGRWSDLRRFYRRHGFKSGRRRRVNEWEWRP